MVSLVYEPIPWEPRAMGTPVEAGVALAIQGLDRFHASDERGTGFQATWRPEHGFINMSLWRDGRCVETFHLTPGQASALVGFVAHSLAEAVPPPSRGALAAVSPIVPSTERRSGVRGSLEDLWQRLPFVGR